MKQRLAVTKYRWGNHGQQQLLSHLDIESLTLPYQAPEKRTTLSSLL
jgi:hypothetical protein